VVLNTNDKNFDSPRKERAISHWLNNDFFSLGFKPLKSILKRNENQYSQNTPSDISFNLTRWTRLYTIKENQERKNEKASVHSWAGNSDGIDLTNEFGKIRSQSFDKLIPVYFKEDSTSSFTSAIARKKDNRWENELFGLWVPKS